MGMFLMSKYNLKLFQMRKLTTIQNDGPESHYIGNLWIEQNNDTQPLLYANSDSSHAGWQPLISSFITAFKKSLGPKSMLPPNGAVVAGAMWYNSILTTSTCPSEASGGYFVKPDGFETARDWLNYAIVLSPGTEGATLRAYSNGQLLRGTASLSPGGLIYGAFEGVSAGFQRMEVVGSDGTILAVAAGGRCISDGCPDCIYNLNPIVVGFGTDTGAVGTCPKSRDCVKVAGDNPGGSGIVYINPSIWTESDPEVFCKPPCILVFPPLLLTATTTITLPPYTTSLVQSRLTTRITTLASGKSDFGVVYLFPISLVVARQASLSHFYLMISRAPQNTTDKDILTWRSTGSTSEILGYSLVSESTVITFPHSKLLGFPIHKKADIKHSHYDGNQCVGTINHSKPDHSIHDLYDKQHRRTYYGYNILSPSDLWGPNNDSRSHYINNNTTTLSLDYNFT